MIKHCNELAEKLGYDRLKFERGDISTYEGTDVADMVVTLHACDLATDYALDKAVKWGARVILAVPCCQHELNRQIKCDSLKPVFEIWDHQGTYRGTAYRCPQSESPGTAGVRDTDTGIHRHGTYSEESVDPDVYKRQPYDRTVFRSIALIMQFGINMLVPICLMSAVGVWMDKHFGTNFWMILLFCMGAVAGGQNVYRMARTIYDDSDEKHTKKDK